MKELGYVPETGSALHDVEEDKEFHLAVHSEKLSFVFALLNTKPGTWIRISKNLHVCGDFHIAAKLISKIVELEIIIRDANCFHHFKNGLCSFGDSWWAFLLKYCSLALFLGASFCLLVERCGLKTIETFTAAATLMRSWIYFFIFYFLFLYIYIFYYFFFLTAAATLDLYMIIIPHSPNDITRAICIGKSPIYFPDFWIPVWICDDKNM